MRKLKRFLIVLTVLAAAFLIYVEVVNRNSKNMTYRQKILKVIYPAWMWWGKITGTNSDVLTGNNQQPPVSFYSLNDTLIDGSLFDFRQLKGKKVLLVNTASNCGYTDQYKELQQLADMFNNKFVVIAFPANDFKKQEKAENKDILEFCKANYGVNFPLMNKSIVIKSQEQNKVFQWLTDPAQNGWNTKAPSWNFCKYLVDEDGKLINYFGSSISPLSNKIINCIK